MPQGRRKIPFSGKAKKAQMKTKKDRQQSDKTSFQQPVVPDETGTGAEIKETAGTDTTHLLIDSVNFGSSGSSKARFAKSDRQRYELLFQQETKEEIKANREMAMLPLPPIAPNSLEIDVESLFPPTLNFPVRPPWDESMDKRTLEAREQKYFRQYMEDVFAAHEAKTLSYFELNLETWRQLWRVIEFSDVLLLVVDCRYAAAMFPPSLFQHIKEMGKDLILVLNKVDLVPPEIALAWKGYFTAKYPGIHVTFFTSYAKYNRCNDPEHESRLTFRRLRGRISMAKEGAQQVFDICQEIVGEHAVDLDSWKDKIDGHSEEGTVKAQEATDEEVRKSKRFENGVLTVGMIGQPNAGKSSLINSLVGKKVVSVSKTPGHTKHFQTIFITDSVKLCDCPGLVFPSLVPKQLQILMGSFPIPQVKDPYSVIGYLCERVNVPWLLALPEPESCQWSAFEVCEAWAVKRGYVTARSNRPDVYRSANHIMRMTLEGKIALVFRPPDFNASEWSGHQDLTFIEEVLGNHKTVEDVQEAHEFFESDEDESEEEEEEEDEAPVFSNKFSALELNE